VICRLFFFSWLLDILAIVWPRIFLFPFFSLNDAMFATSCGRILFLRVCSADPFSFFFLVGYSLLLPIELFSVQHRTSAGLPMFFLGPASLRLVFSSSAIAATRFGRARRFPSGSSPFLALSRFRSA